MGAIRENVHLHNFVFSKLINQFTPNNTVRETDLMNYLLVIQKPSFMQQLAELILKFLLDNRQRLTTCCKKKHLINSSKQRTNDIAKSVGFPLTMVSSNPGGNSKFLAGTTRPLLLRYTALPLISRPSVILLAIPCVVPGVVNTATYASINDNGKRKWSHKAIFVPSPSPCPVPLHAHPSSLVPSPGPPAMLQMSICECPGPIGCNLKMTKLLPLSSKLSETVFCCNNKCKNCASFFSVTKTTINKTASFITGSMGFENVFKVSLSETKQCLL